MATYYDWKGAGGIRDAREMFRGRSANADLNGPPTYVRVWLVRTTAVDVPHKEIAKAVQSPLRQQYPDDPDAILVNMAIAQEGESPFHYKVTCTYKFVDESEAIPWFRPAQFSFSGSLTSAPAFWHYHTSDNVAKKIIVNSAGDPLGGLDRDEGDFSVTVQFNQKPPFDYALAQSYVGSINSDTWSGGAPRTWKIQSLNATRKFEMVPNIVDPSLPAVKTFFFDVSVQVAYRATGWDLQTWDVGFNEIIDNKKVKIKDSLREPVSEPAALSNGSAKPPGVAPDMLTFRIYPLMPFMDVLAEIPTTVPEGYPYDYVPE